MTLLALPPRKWKWRMRGAALAFEPLVRSLPRPPDLLVTTDMLNLPELIALLRDRLPADLPIFTYFHENQLTYPLAAADVRDFHFGLANLYSALASTCVVFNSAFHRDEFCAALEPLLRAMPDERPSDVGARVLARSRVLGVPLDLPAPPAPARRESLVLWNHRWEEDKDPERFFGTMRELDRRGADFGMVVAGQSFRERPECFERARVDLAHRIRHWGFAAARDDYLGWLARCRVVVSTARHEFYGLAVREAIGMGCYPLLPRRVVYPELVGGRPEHLYDSDEDLVERLSRLLGESPLEEACPDPALVSDVRSLNVESVVARWDEWIDQAA